MPTTEPVDVKKLAGLAEFDSTTLQELMRHASPRRLQPGEILIHEGDSVGHCYLVQDGKLRVQVSRGDGSNIILDHVGAGALCGEQALLRPGGKRSATVSAVESTLVLEFEARRIRNALKKNPHVKQLWSNRGKIQRNLQVRGLLGMDDSTADYSTQWFAPGEVIIERGSPPDFFYLILHGEVELLRNGRLLTELEQGDIFGLLGILNDTPRYATVVATRRVELRVFSRDTLPDPISPGLRHHLTQRMELYRLESGSVLRRITIGDDDENWVKTTRQTIDSSTVHSLYEPTARTVRCGSVARTGPVETAPTASFESPTLDVRRSLWLSPDQRLLGLEAVGGWSQLPAMIDAIQREDLVTNEALDAFTETGVLPLKDARHRQLVCACLGISRTEIQAAVELGAATPVQLAKTLGCGTVCGTCVPQLENLCGANSGFAVESTMTRRAADVVAIRFRRPGGQPLPASKPGQHVLISLRIGEQWHHRPYTLTSPAGQHDYYEVATQYVPTGALTEHLFDPTTRAHEFKVSEPRGDFVWEPLDGPLVCLVAGIGVTPAIAMVRTAILHRSRSKIVVDYSFKTKDHAVFTRELTVADLYENMEVRLRNTSQEGRLKRSRISALADENQQARFFVCGPPGFMEFVIDQLTKQGVRPERIYQERFVPPPQEPEGTHPKTIGYRTGAALAVAAVALLFSNVGHSLVMPGPQNTGHDELGCESCHVEATGTARQQIQANTSHWLGYREHPADFGYATLDNQTCLRCHVHDDDRHPVYRFSEPRFADLRETLGPDQCISCHSEHTGRRATVQPEFCQHCHEDLELDNDPVDISHAKLISNGDWTSCLGCHDFHGNHPHEPQAEYLRKFSADNVNAYLAGGESPYGSRIVESIESGDTRK